ncbi:hypothetical protein D5086_008646 [Populus alba]|uniref:Uncharacterized protein n=1 Tax=Populus alba TaxID=43335 RepID=A0ACC4CHH4_POPAL
MANYHDSLMPCGPDFNGPLVLWSKTRCKPHDLALCYDAPNVKSAEVQIGIRTDEMEEVVLAFTFRLEYEVEDSNGNRNKIISPSCVALGNYGLTNHKNVGVSVSTRITS